MLYVLALMVIFGSVHDVWGMHKKKSGGKYAGSSLKEVQPDSPIQRYDLGESLKRRPTFDQMNAELANYITKEAHGASLQTLRSAHQEQQQRIAALETMLLHDRNMLLALIPEHQAMQQLCHQRDADIDRLVWVISVLQGDLQIQEQQYEILSQLVADQRMQLAQLNMQPVQLSALQSQAYNQ